MSWWKQRQYDVTIKRKLKILSWLEEQKDYRRNERSRNNKKKIYRWKKKYITREKSLEKKYKLL